MDSAMLFASGGAPYAIVLPPRFERYHAVSKVVMDTLGAFSPLVEPLSLDEAFVDMTGYGTTQASPISQRCGKVRRRLGVHALKVSVDCDGQI